MTTKENDNDSGGHVPHGGRQDLEPAASDTASHAGTSISVPDSDLARLMALRAELFAALKVELEEDGHCKSYEGQFSLTVVLPNYFESQQGGELWWKLHLDCYKIGPHRHYDWIGATFEECLQKAQTDIRAWIAGDDSSKHFED